ncbi:MAG TPA: hypothetical protein VMV13_08235 [Candidatus Binataceae bacterium]|nr:hypothetical protein [Candidatus Binataceae bacterium]
MRSIPVRAMTLILLASALVVSRAPAMAAPVAMLLGFSSADFEILDPANSSVIGHARYAVTKEGDGIALHGHDRYANGQYDFESDRFETPAGALPILTSADHYFFLANGAPEFQSNFDVKSGLATCIDFRSQPPLRQNAQLETPPDTWMGASVMVPIQDFLRRGGSGTLQMHVFSCAPSPKIFAVRVSITQAQAHSPLSRPGVVEVDFKPDFGWLNLIAAPFVPHLNAWFDPAHDWDFVGAALVRFYQGPNILLARTTSPGASADSAEQAPLR